MANYRIITDFHLTVFSLARFYGGCKINEKVFLAVYPGSSETSRFINALVREDLMQKFNELPETGKKFGLERDLRNLFPFG